MKIVQILVIDDNHEIKENIAYYSSSDVIDHGVNAGKNIFDFAAEKFWEICCKYDPQLRKSWKDYTAEEWADDDIGGDLPSIDDGLYGTKNVMIYMLYPDAV